MSSTSRIKNLNNRGNKEHAFHLLPELTLGQTLSNGLANSSKQTLDAGRPEKFKDLPKRYLNINKS